MSENRPKYVDEITCFECGKMIGLRQSDFPNPYGNEEGQTKIDCEKCRIEYGILCGDYED